MNAVKYLRNRFEFAAKGSGTIRLNQNDIEAINKLIEFENDQKRNTDLEDSLLLFYLLSAWKIENHNNKVFLASREYHEKVFPMTITNADVILNRISTFINPKKEMMRMVADELWVHQVYNKIPKENQVKFDEVEKLLEDVLAYAKSNFPMIKALGKDFMKFLELKPLSKT